MRHGRRFGDLELSALAVDVRELLERSVTSLRSHLVTRPTGRAVRIAIERQLDMLVAPALSLVDLSSVAILDYSCADEVVAKLLLRKRGPAGSAFFVLMGVKAHHRDPIEAVLERHALAVVAETGPGRYNMIGVGSDGERTLWSRVERSGCVRAGKVAELVAARGQRRDLDALLTRRLVFRNPASGDLHALSTLLRT
ncbi:MAG: hypothetical protein OYK82_04905 [Gammaproteobacteria bacterium]|nr:hypothetical protein [Gammaproteobacteria bacterium]